MKAQYDVLLKVSYITVNSFDKSMYRLRSVKREIEANKGSLEENVLEEIPLLFKGLKRRQWQVVVEDHEVLFLPLESLNCKQVLQM